MSRIPGVEAGRAGLFAKIAYWFTKRKLGKVVTPLKITAHHPKMLFGVAMMEQAQADSNLVDGRLKRLAQLRTATLVGCPF